MDLKTVRYPVTRPIIPMSRLALRTQAPALIELRPSPTVATDCKGALAA